MMRTSSLLIGGLGLGALLIFACNGETLVVADRSDAGASSSGGSSSGGGSSTSSSSSSSGGSSTSSSSSSGGSSTSSSSGGGSSTSSSGSNGSGCSLPCPPTDICERDRTVGGAQVFPVDDAGTCPPGKHVNGNVCEDDGTYKCVPRPAACTPAPASVDCACAGSLCTDANRICEGAQGSEVDCVLEAP